MLNKLICFAITQYAVFIQDLQKTRFKYEISTNNKPDKNKKLIFKYVCYMLVNDLMA